VTVIGFEGELDDQQRRRLLWAMPTGIYVLGSTSGPDGSLHLMTHSLAVQVATEPCVVALAVEASAKTHEYVVASNVAALSVLRREQRELVRRFVKPVEATALEGRVDEVSMGGAVVARAPSGAPFLRDSLGCLDLRVLDATSFASHTTFFCEVTGVAVAPEVTEGSASARVAQVLRMEDTKMNYGG
jgi:flavin reductase (DIM6/NTAB) family NADH-FMN oxidoreductase RutF